MTGHWIDRQRNFPWHRPRNIPDTLSVPSPGEVCLVIHPQATPATQLVKPHSNEIDSSTSLSSHHFFNLRRPIVNMARNAGGGAPVPDTTALDLSRLLARLQNILVTPDSATETKLRASSYEREKVGTVSFLLPPGMASCSDRQHRTSSMRGHSSYG
jgi:hypothetical protein